MSEVSNGEPERVGNPGGYGRVRFKWSKWGHLPEAKRTQYEAIEERVRDKVKRGEL